MKKNLLTIGTFAIVVAIGFLAACKKDAKTVSGDRALTAGTKVTFPDGTVIGGTVTDTIVNSGDTIHLTCGTYYLDGKLYINPGGVIVIDPGVVVKGIIKGTPAEASALIVTKGGKIHAQGTAEAPITFTSNEASPAPGNWGGVVILGAAPTNQNNPRIEGIAANVPAGVSVNYGNAVAGEGDANDDSGDFYYVRILYAGAIIAPNDELNSLTLGGVGAGTDIHHVYAAFGSDDSFEFFGGTVSPKYLISQSTNDDNFDFDFGFVGKIQYAVSFVDDQNSYNNDANGIELDNTGAACNNVSPLTNPELANFTIIGGNTAKRTGTLHAVRVRRSGHLNIYNSVILGYDTAFHVDGCATSQLVAGYNVTHAFNATSTTNVAGSFPGTNTVFVNSSSSNSGILLRLPFGDWCATFDGRPNSATSPARNGANWGWAGAFFDNVTYRGAFDPSAPADDWTAFACLEGCAF